MVGTLRVSADWQGSQFLKIPLSRGGRTLSQLPFHCSDSLSGMSGSNWPRVPLARRRLTYDQKNTLDDEEVGGPTTDARYGLWDVRIELRVRVNTACGRNTRSHPLR